MHTTRSLGGIAGHAGLFSTAGDVARLVAAFLFPTETADNSSFQLVSAATARLFMREFNQTQSSRALGFNTNDPAAFGACWRPTCSYSPYLFCFEHLSLCVCHCIF